MRLQHQLRRRRSAVFSLAVLCIASCGAGGVSKGEYVEQANAVCSKANGRVEGVLAQEPASFKEFIATLRKVNVITRETLAMLRSMKTPMGDHEILERQYTVLAEALDVGDESIAASERGDEPAAKAASERRARLLAKVNEAARRYGMTDCAK